MASICLYTRVSGLNRAYTPAQPTAPLRCSHRRTTLLIWLVLCYKEVLMSSRWKKYVSSVLSQPSSERDAILSIVDVHAPGRDNSILLEAFSNFFSKSNVAAEHQCFTLRDGSILDISREGIYILDEHRTLSLSVLDSNIAIHDVVGPSNWALYFYGKFYGSLDPLNRGEEK